MSFALIVQPPADQWPRLLQDWAWLIDGQIAPVTATLFGDAFLLRRGGGVEFLDGLEGTLTQVVETVAELKPFLDTPRGRELLNAESAELLWARGLRPSSDQCYGYEVAPIIGGSMDFDHIKLFSRVVYMSLQGQLHRQLRERR